MSLSTTSLFLLEMSEKDVLALFENNTNEGSFLIDGKHDLFSKEEKVKNVTTLKFLHALFIALSNDIEKYFHEMDDAPDGSPQRALIWEAIDRSSVRKSQLVETFLIVLKKHYLLSLQHMSPAVRFLFKQTNEAIFDLFEKNREEGIFIIAGERDLYDEDEKVDNTPTLKFLQELYNEERYFIENYSGGTDAETDLDDMIWKSEQFTETFMIVLLYTDDKGKSM
jgi:hypothetical protein